MSLAVMWVMMAFVKFNTDRYIMKMMTVIFNNNFIYILRINNGHFVNIMMRHDIVVISHLFSKVKNIPDN